MMLGLNPLWWAAPLVAQGVALGLDEALFHRKRRLPLWERIGHPLDTLTILGCLAWARWAPYSSGALRIFAAAAVFSCLFVTKDELVHARECRAAEHWLHAVLFLLHPIGLAAAALLWRAGARGVAIAPSILSVQLVLVAAFLGYQVIYWNFRHELRNQQRVLQ